MVNIYPDEVTDDLQLNGLSIIQKKSGFKFGIDAVLLSDFAKDSPSKATLDLCTGTGIIPLLLSAKTNTSKICGLEIQPQICEMAKRSVVLNNLCDRIEIREGDLKEAVSIYGKASFDKITCNPPYMKCGAGLTNDVNTKVISRHEVCCTLEDVIRVSSLLLEPMGKFFMVHRPSRLSEIFSTMIKYRLEPKIIRFVSPSINKAPNLVLIEGIRDAKSDLKILPELFVYDSNGSYTEEINKIYNRS